MGIADKINSLFGNDRDKENTSGQVIQDGGIENIYFSQATPEAEEAGPGKPRNADDIVYFLMSRSHMCMDGCYTFKVVKGENKILLNSWYYGTDAGGIRYELENQPIMEEDFRQLLEILRGSALLTPPKAERAYEQQPNVCDGTSYSFNVRFTDGEAYQHSSIGGLENSLREKLVEISDKYLRM